MNEFASVIIVTGISGSGKSQAISYFEDQGYFCIDNLPLELFDKVIGLSRSDSGGKFKKIAFGIDSRTNRDFSKLFDFVTDLKKKRIPVKVLFFDAGDDILLRRFSETRRRHPLETGRGGILSGLKRERQYMSPVLSRADHYIDSSNYKIADLRHALSSIIGKRKKDIRKALGIEIIAFGYRSGIPENADIVMDVRFLPNPFYETALRKKTGLSQSIKNYIFRSKENLILAGMFNNLISRLIPRYIEEGKAYLTIAFGCTGGRHRSVASADILYRKLLKKGYNVRLTLRDLND